MTVTGPKDRSEQTGIASVSHSNELDLNEFEGFQTQNGRRFSCIHGCAFYTYLPILVYYRREPYTTQPLTTESPPTPMPVRIHTMCPVCTVKPQFYVCRLSVLWCRHLIYLYRAFSPASNNQKGQTKI